MWYRCSLHMGKIINTTYLKTGVQTSSQAETREQLEFHSKLITTTLIKRTINQKETYHIFEKLVPSFLFSRKINIIDSLIFLSVFSKLEIMTFCKRDRSVHNLQNWTLFKGLDTLVFKLVSLPDVSIFVNDTNIPAPQKQNLTVDSYSSTFIDIQSVLKTCQTDQDLFMHLLPH